MRLKDQIDAAPGKLRSLIKKFLDDLFLKRLTPFIKFDLSKATTPGGTVQVAKRTWPKSEKDEKIKAIMDERRKQEEEAARLKQEEAEKQAQLDAEANAAGESNDAPVEVEKKETDEEEKKEKTVEGSVMEEDDDEEEDASEQISS